MSSIAKSIKRHKWASEKDPFRGSPYAGIACVRGPQTKNKRICQAVADLLEREEVTVEILKKGRGLGSYYLRLEKDPKNLSIVRLSTAMNQALWSSLYDDAEIDFAFLVHLTPTEERIWEVPMSVLREYVGTRVGKTNNPTLRINPEDPPAWLDEYECVT